MQIQNPAHPLSNPVAAIHRPRTAATARAVVETQLPQPTNTNEAVSITGAGQFMSLLSELPGEDRAQLAHFLDHMRAAAQELQGDIENLMENVPDGLERIAAETGMDLEATVRERIVQVTEVMNHVNQAGVEINRAVTSFMAEGGATPADGQRFLSDLREASNAVMQDARGVVDHPSMTIDDMIAQVLAQAGVRDPEELAADDAEAADELADAMPDPTLEEQNLG